MPVTALPPRPRIRPRVIHLDLEDRAAHGRPATPYEALMAAPFGREPEVSVVEALAFRDVLVDALLCLDARELWVLEAHHYRDRSFGEIAVELSISKSYAYVLYRKALRRLEEQVHDEPIIRAYLDRP